MELGFAAAGARTVLAKQYAAYPFHLTRPFHLGDTPRGMATLYLQSASGGLYRADDLAIAIDVAPGAAAEITTQASTIVHNAHGDPARLRQTLMVGEGAFLMLWPEPTILLPGAMLQQEIDVTLADGGSAMVAEAWMAHDPLGQGRAFDLLDSATVVRVAGRRLVAERQRIRGSDWPVALGGGRWTSAGSAFLLGPLGSAVGVSDLAAASTEAAAIGASMLPNGAGLGIRILAADGVALSAALRDVWRIAFRAAFGNDPLPRRK